MLHLKPIRLLSIRGGSPEAGIKRLLLGSVSETCLLKKRGQEYLTINILFGGGASESLHLIILRLKDSKAQGMRIANGA